MSTKNCRDCKHWFDWTAVVNTHAFPLGSYACESPELRKHLAINPHTGFQNKSANADTCRDMPGLCGPDAVWFEEKK